MEDFEKALIDKNLPSLLDLTTCSTSLLAFLKSSEVLSDDEVERIAAKTTKLDKAMLLYSIICTRKDAYTVLLRALVSTNQSGAAEILFNITEAEIENMQIELFGKIQRVKAVLNRDQIHIVETRLRKNMTFEECLKIRENIIKKDTVVRLLPDSIPQHQSCYISRLITRRVVVNPKLFATNCPDVFVFKGVDRLQLRKFVSSYNIYLSTEQLRFRKIASKLILLNNEDDWEKLCSKVTDPMHLIRYVTKTEEFVLELTTGGSTVLNEYLTNGNNGNPETISEDQLVEYILSEKSIKISICDAPGMGKSYLLSSIAGKVSQKCPNTVVVYIPLRELNLSKEATENPETVLLQHISLSQLSYHILVAITKQTEIKFVLLFDGLDEVLEENLELTTKFLANIGILLPQANMLITSRPSARGKLEEIVGAVSFDIQPFNTETQVTFLKTIWMHKTPGHYSDALEKYASICLQKLQEIIKKEDKKFAGVPLLCTMIAEVFMDEAVAYVHSNQSIPEEELCKSANSFVEVYERYLERQLGNTKCGFQCLRKHSSIKCDRSCRVKSFHAWLAIQLVSPKFAKQITQYIVEFDDLKLKEICSPAILHQPESKALQFVHRTYAEYLVAEFLAKSVTRKSGIERENSEELNRRIVHEIILQREIVISYFLNGLIHPDLDGTGYIFNNATISLSRNEIFDSALHCARYNYESILELLFIAKTTQNKSASLGRTLKYSKMVDKAFVRFNQQTILKTLEYAAQHCKLVLLDKLHELYWCYGINIYTQFAKKKNCDKLLGIVLRSADYEFASRILGSVNYYNKDFLAQCLQNAYLDEVELVEKKLEVAHLLLEKFSSLVKCSVLFDDILETIFQPHVHVRAVKLLFNTQIKHQSNTVGGFALDIGSSKYMSTAAFKDVCAYIISTCSGETLPDVDNLWKETVLRTTFIETLKLKSPKLHHFLGETFRNSLLQAVRQGDVPLLDSILNRDRSLLEFEVKYIDNATLIFYATEHRQPAVFEYLVSRGANMFATNVSGETILHVAAQTKDWQFFNCVVEVLGTYKDKCTQLNSISKDSGPRGHPINIVELFGWKTRFSKSTPLHYVCQNMDLPLETLDLFLAIGRPSFFEKVVNINALNASNETPLYVAKMSGRTSKFIELLVSRGATAQPFAEIEFPL